MGDIFIAVCVLHSCGKVGRKQKKRGRENSYCHRTCTVAVGTNCAFTRVSVSSEMVALGYIVQRVKGFRFIGSRSLSWEDTAARSSPTV